MKKMHGYRLLPHTADMGVEAWGPHIEGLFIAAGQGIKAILIGQSPTTSRATRVVRLTAENDAELLVAWLNEILYYFETDNLVPSSFDIDHIGDGKLCGKISGDDFQPGVHYIEHQVKAVTYHNLALTQTGGRWVARVYVDL